MDSQTSIENWIKNRKSTFLNGLKEGGSIDDAIIEKLLENASWAPSHGLVQPWYFKVFTGEGLKTFYSKQQEVYKSTTPAEKFKQDKYDKFLKKADKVSHVIAILMKRDPKKRFPYQEDLVSAACATQNIYLSMQAYGVAGYLSTGDICYQPAILEFLEVDKEDTCIGFFTLGIPDEDFKRPPRKRIPVSEKTEWIRS